MLDRPGILVALSLLPAIVALVGLGVSPSVTTSWDGDTIFFLHGWLGLPTIVTGCRLGAQRRIHPRLRALVPTGAIIAAVGGVVLGVGLVPVQAAGSAAIASVLVLMVYLGLALAEGAAAASILAGTAIRSRGGQILRAAGFAGAIITVILLMLVTMQPLTEPFASPIHDLGESLLIVILPTIWAIVAVTTLDRLETMPEFAGRVQRPRVEFDCPRCGTRQRQAGSAGCRRCGLDVRVEVL